MKRKSRSRQVAEWARQHLDANGLIDRWKVQAEAQRVGLPSANHMYAGEHPYLEKVPGTTLARPV